MIKTADSFKSKPFPLENPGRFVIIAKPSNPNETLTHKIFTVLISGGSLDPVTIIIRKYQYGDSVAKFVNLCEDLIIDVKEMNGVENFEQKLNPYHSFYFVWPELVKSSRELVWNIDGASGPNNQLKFFLTKSGMTQHIIPVEMNALRRDPSSDSDFVSEDHHKSLITRNKSLKYTSAKTQVNVSCVSYIEGTQRIILFTTDTSLAEIERRKEAASMEIFLSLKGRYFYH